ncbi:MAG: hypothetical protein ACTS5I_06445 [Rhodanobacter sp.]
MTDQAARNYFESDAREEVRPTLEVSDEALEAAGARELWNMPHASRDFTIQVSSPCCKKKK